MTVTAITQTQLDRLHPVKVEDPQKIKDLLGLAFKQAIPIRRGLTKIIEPEVASISRLTNESLTLSAKTFDRAVTEGNFSFTLGGSVYFFSSPAAFTETDLVVDVPTSVYVVERRERLRRPTTGSAWLSPLDSPSRHSCKVQDRSTGGIGIECQGVDLRTGQPVRVETDTGIEDGSVRSVFSSPAGNGWTRIGIQVGEAPPPLLSVERRASILDASPTESLRRRLSTFSATLSMLASRASSAIVSPPEAQLERLDIRASDGSEIAALVDRTDGIDGRPIAIVLPPAWGKTKETLLPLARTLVAMFQRAKVPAMVVRFDGVDRRGESRNSSGETTSNRNLERFRISRCVTDLCESVNWIQANEDPEKTFVVSISAGAIEARRAVRLLGKDLVDGWIAVVGPADLQSSMRIVSGGIDYIGGFERGVKFGVRETLGVRFDVDEANEDAAANGLATLHDAYDDFRQIETPITWVHGKHDAWMDLDRAKRALSHGNLKNRRLIEIPVGHQLRSSAEAIQVFQLIGAEIARLADAAAPLVTPDLADMSARRNQERRLARQPNYEPSEFWHDYLLGTTDTFAMELFHRTSAYRELMRDQVEALALSDNSSVLDLGGGTGELSRHLDSARSFRITTLDLVPDALREARARNATSGPIVADLNTPSMPFQDQSFDCVLASLFLSYISDPVAVIRETIRVTRPGGRIVFSSLRRDADLSKVWRAEEPNLIREARLQGPEEESRTRRSLPEFLNAASKVAELEEWGVFTFWEPDELAQLIESAGASIESVRPAIGNPPQGFLVSASV